MADAAPGSGAARPFVCYRAQVQSLPHRQVAPQRHPGLRGSVFFLDIRYLERRVGDRELAEDILQDAFIKVMDRPDQAAAGEGLVPWFDRTLRNAAIDRFRRRLRVQGAPHAARMFGVLVALIVALPIHDYVVRRRLHPASTCGAIVILMSFPLRFAVGNSVTWHHLASRIIP